VRRVELAEDARSRCGRAGEQPLPHHSEEELALQLAASSRRDEHAVGAASRLGEQPTLADPGGTLDDDRAATPLASLFDQRIELGQLTLALE
jgi:hypothetical protein